MEVQTKDVIVIGAGQAGLALGYCLKKQGINFVIIDSVPQVGYSWQTRWDSLELFSARKYCALPGLAFPGKQSGHPGKDEVADYLKKYAKHFELPVILNSRVNLLEKRNGIFTAHTASAEYEARQAVIATGPFQLPRIAEFAKDIAAFQLHSSEYSSPASLPFGSVLVVGAGNSGAQISYELASAGREVVVSSNAKLRFIPKQPFGKSISFWARILGLKNISARSFLGRKFSQKGRPFIIGKNLRPFIKKGIVEVKGALLGAENNILEFSDNTRMTAPEIIIWATGYSPDYSWLGIAGTLTDAGMPCHKDGLSPVAGLYFLGLDWQRKAASGFLDGIGSDAEFIAGNIKKYK